MKMISSNLKEVNCISLTLFNSVVESDAPQRRDEIGPLIFDYNVFVTPKASYALDEIEKFVQSTRKTAEQLNATFYRSWKTIYECTRHETLIDQLNYYSSVRSGLCTVPVNEFPIDLDADAMLPIFVIGVKSANDLIEETLKLVKSGTPLKEETNKDIMKLWDLLGFAPKSVADIKNKETRVMLMDRFKVYDVTPEEFVRYLVYLATNNTLVIKNHHLRSRIKSSKCDISKLCEDYGLPSLAKVFNRYRYVFVAFKRAHINNKNLVNRITKLSKKYHTPLPVNPLNALASRLLSAEESRKLKSATTNQLLRALNFCYLAKEYQRGFAYNIRNGKVWISDKERSQDAQKIAGDNMNIILPIVKSRLQSRFYNKKVYTPPGVTYGLPLSERQMLGNIPFNTKFETTDNMAVGIFWDKGYNCDDLDLSAICLEGAKIGWNDQYYAKGLAYSGDVVELGEHGATEYLLADKTECKDTLNEINVNCYTGNSDNHKFDILVAEGDEIDKEYMMNPSNVWFSALYHADSTQTTIGVFQKHKGMSTFLLAPRGNGRSLVSLQGPMTRFSIAALKHNMKYSLNLQELLKIIGCEFVESAEDAEIDLSINKLDKSFFNLFTGDS